MTQVKWIGLKELKEAVKRNPKKVLAETRNFLVEGLALYKKGIISSPWRVGGSDGGSPVSNDPKYKRKYQRQRSGNLRDTHQTTIGKLEGIIGPTAKYAVFVHKGTRKMKARPWMDYVERSNESKIIGLSNNLLKNITKDLSK